MSDTAEVAAEGDTSSSAMPAPEVDVAALQAELAKWKATAAEAQCVPGRHRSPSVRYAVTPHRKLALSLVVHLDQTAQSF